MTYRPVAELEPPPSGQRAKVRALATQNSLSVEARQILEEVRTALENDLEAASAGVARLAVLLGSKDAAPVCLAPSKGGLAPWQKRKVEAYIDDRLDAPILTENLAEVASLSVSHFSRAFKESFGETPHAHIVRMRIKRAQQMMLTTSEPLSQIAVACGLADQAHLSKLFRREIGQTPSAWRRINALGACRDWSSPTGQDAQAA